nr:ribonuclease H-like domain-containing protein [Tanacetum cinerariifolium]GFB98806.1 ribonuclease H-like domain-containing protein [Tanacetum cinerariifolium]
MAFISSAKHSSGNEDGNTACVPTASASDINQIDEDDMEKMDIKWNMALLSMRADKFWKKTGKKISNQGSDVAGFDKSKVECFNCLTDYSRPSPNMESTSGDDQNRTPSVSENVASPITPKPFIKFVKPKDNQSKSKTDETETPK